MAVPPWSCHLQAEWCRFPQPPVTPCVLQLLNSLHGPPAGLSLLQCGGAGAAAGCLTSADL